MKALIRMVITVAALSLAYTSFACGKMESCSHINGIGGKTVVFVGSTSGTIVNGLADGTSKILRPALVGTHHILHGHWTCMDRCD